VVFGLVFPALLLNYFGQGALAPPKHPDAVSNPFYNLAPSWFLVPLLVLATLAAIVASQALISGAFSVTQSGHATGIPAAHDVQHTSSNRARGRSTFPKINWLLHGRLGRSCSWRRSAASTKLGAAYGIAVTGTMAIHDHPVFYAKWPGRDNGTGRRCQGQGCSSVLHSW
jgi:KUP system potassium uptake protein